jgi:hypothetical protein
LTAGIEDGVEVVGRGVFEQSCRREDLLGGGILLDS